MHVHDNKASGGSFNYVQTFFNTANGNGDVHNNQVSGDGDDNEVQTFDNSIDGNLQVQGNQATGGSSNVVDVSGNDVGKELGCGGNRPQATNDVAGANSAKKKSGECANL